MMNLRFFCKTLILLCLIAALYYVFSSVAFAEGRGQVIVELRNNSGLSHTSQREFPERRVHGTDNLDKKEYKFKRVREGINFSYVLANLKPSFPYNVELSFVEPDFSASRMRVFNVYLQGSRVLEKLDIFKESGGKYRAFQRRFSVRSDTAGRLFIQFRSDEPGCSGKAIISTIRVFRGASTEVVEISASASRQRSSFPIRFENGQNQNCFEALLGRLGSRFFINLAPQRLAARVSSLGTGTGDLHDLVIAIRQDSEIRALPFTDRYPVWESIDQRQTMTAYTYDCSSPALPFKLKARFRAPFYPGDEKISSAPIVFLDLFVKNQGNRVASGEVLFAIPHKRWFNSSRIKPYDSGDVKGYTYSTFYNYEDESINYVQSKVATEAVCVRGSDTSDIEFKGLGKSDFDDFSHDRIWDFVSPQGYPRVQNDHRFPFFTFFPKGYSGIKWRIENLGPGATVSKRLVLAGHVSQRILRVKNRSYDDDTYRFKYTSYFSDLSELLVYAFQESSEMISKSSFFDSTIGSGEFLYLSPTYIKEFRNLVSYAFQSFLANTWWALSEKGREWFSTWEGTDCRFHSTVDVEYNNAWFYLHFFPDLLKRVMDQWILYLKESREGFFLSHDMGRGDFVGGQVYPHDMPVEENTNYILLLYKYWKTTGDGGYVRRRFSTVRSLLDFLFRCDTNNNGIPDIHTANTIDDASFALQFSRDQTYLGVKCLAAYHAGAKLAELVRDWEYLRRCKSRIMQINQTLEGESWLSDRFVVSLDSRCADRERDAYSIYASNGLVYLLSSDFTCGLSSQNIDRIKKDLATSSINTKAKFGSVHTSYDSRKQWLSQNMWRDQAALFLGVPVEGRDTLMMVRRYWDALLYFARYLNGGFWDVVVYSGAVVKGASLQYSGVFYCGEAVNAQGAAKFPGNSIASKGISASALGQGLGYYPRGTAALGLLSAAAGISLDVPGDRLFYRPSTKPVKVPIFERADWHNPDSSKRVPVISFTKDGTVSFKNSHLLPTIKEPRRERKVVNTWKTANAISPDGDGVNDRFEVKYSLDDTARIAPAIWDGRRKVRTFPELKQKGQIVLNWDGKDDAGKTVNDGLYWVGLDASPSDRRLSLTEDHAVVWVNRTTPNLSSEWHLAEGYTAGKFDTYILIQNPDSNLAKTEVRYMLPGGQTLNREYLIKGKSRFTISVDSIFPSSEVSAYVKADRKIAVERAMYFNGRRSGHASTGVATPSTKWYFAEGCTAHGFDTFILICNPGEEEARIKVTFMTPGMGNVRKSISVPPHSRFTIWLNEILPERDVSTLLESSVPIVAERAQYFNDMTSGTCSIGAVSTSRTWYLAEGCTGHGFEEFILVQNPNKDPCNISVRFMKSDGTSTLRNYDLPPECRFTIGVNEIVPESDISARVTSSRPVLVERAMYWNNRIDGHACLATPTPDASWYLAEGYTGGDFETWILVQNPSDNACTVKFTFMEPGGGTLSREYALNPQSRFTLDARQFLPSAEFSTEISGSEPIIVERSVYFGSRSGGTCTPGIRGWNY